MQRIAPIGIAIVGLCMASVAHAASVVLSASTPSGFLLDELYVGHYGETLTLTVTVTADAGEVDTSVFGVIQYQGFVFTPIPLSQQQSALPPTANGPWNHGVLPACTTINCRAFAQTNSGGTVGVTNFVIATMQFTHIGSIGAIGHFNWQSAPLSQRLDFFGVTGGPGISVLFVPEPTTAALLGAGLFGLALAARRRE